MKDYFGGPTPTNDRHLRLSRTSLLLTPTCLLSLFRIALLIFILVGCGRTQDEGSEYRTNNVERAAIVYVCMGGSAYAYHDHYCRGLKECEADVEQVEQQEAIRMERKACGYCYR
jgi:hypothetical protein